MAVERAKQAEQKRERLGERERPVEWCPCSFEFEWTGSTCFSAQQDVLRRAGPQPSCRAVVLLRFQFESCLSHSPMGMATTSYERRLLAAADLVLSADSQDQGTRLPDLGVTADLKPHQLDGVAWLIRRYRLGVNVVLDGAWQDPTGDLPTEPYQDQLYCTWTVPGAMPSKRHRWLAVRIR